MIRVAVRVEGTVQGVGFRPFVHAAATARGLTGWVGNRRDGVRLEVEGRSEAVRAFMDALRREPPPASRVTRIDVREVPPVGSREFSIVDSAGDDPVRPTLPADQATCAACFAEVATPGSRRFRHPFTTCAGCGPRFTVVEALPYDRQRTTMAGFPLCGACASEYADPADRRFHAETIACPACGPTLRLVSSDGSIRSDGASALDEAVGVLRAGGILALMGVGGFQLLVVATDAAAVARLRRRKRRPHKPFAVLVAAVDDARRACVATAADARALGSTAAPIVLLRRRQDPEGPRITGEVAPANPTLGVMLPPTPLHRMIAGGVARPLVCTSGNLSEEPLCIDPAEARTRLADIADAFLVHDRAIVRPVDDSVVRVGPAGLQVLRRARGFAPEPLPLAERARVPVLALGAQLKSTVALAVGDEVVVSQHLGDLHDAIGAQLLERTVADLVRLFDVRPGQVVCDLHPDYVSTRLAERLAARWGVPLARVQHHHAHVAAVVAEHGLTGPVLGLAWDGAGLGRDGALWGGEALLLASGGARRVAHLRPFPLPGGEAAVREPRRAALGLLHVVFGADAACHAGDLFRDGELRVLLPALASGRHAPPTTAVGRLFDGVAALVGLPARTTFEGQAAMALEFAAEGCAGVDPYPFPLGPEEPAVADWAPLLRAVLADRAAGVPRRTIAARFHAALADLAVTAAERAGVGDVVVSGGCFQNLLLTTAVRARLVARGFTVHVPRRVPPNDGGIALGQALVAIRGGRGR